MSIFYKTETCIYFARMFKHPAKVSGRVYIIVAFHFSAFTCFDLR